MNAPTLPRLQRQSGAARAFRAAMGLARALAAIPMRVTPPPFRLIQMGSAFWQSCALATAARLDVATCLGDEVLDAATLAARLPGGADADALARLMRFLVSLGVFSSPSPGWFANNKHSTWLRSDRKDSVRAMVLMHNAPEMRQPWYEWLDQGLRQGRPPFELAHGQGLFDCMDQNPALDQLFARAMDSVDALTGDSFATAFDWRRFDRILDLGGSVGAKSLAILKRHPHLRACVLDRAATVQSAPAHWAAKMQIMAAAGADGAARAEATRDALSRMRFVPGDLLRSGADDLPALRGPGDVYLLCAVLHGMDDSTARGLLQGLARQAAPAGASLVLLEMVMPEHRADEALAAFDMQMFMGTRGRERSPTQWRQLLAGSGWDWVQTVSLASLASMLVLQPGKLPDARGAVEGEGMDRSTPSA